MTNMRNKSDEYIRDKAEGYGNEAKAARKEYNRRGLEEEHFEEESSYESEDFGTPIFFVGLFIGAIALFIGFNYIHYLVQYAYTHTVLSVLAFAVVTCLLLFATSGHKALAILFFIGSMPLAMQFFPSFIGDHYIAFLLSDTSTIDAIELAKYGVYLVLYLLVFCGIATGFVYGITKELHKDIS